MPEVALSPFAPRPRQSPSHHLHRERLDRITHQLTTIWPLHRDRLENVDGEGMLIAEALIIRADSIVKKLPQELFERLPAEMKKGLSGVRNIAAHEFARLSPDRTIAVLEVHLPTMLDRVRDVLDELDF